MKHLLGCLLLSSLCDLSSWGIRGTSVVTQSPPSVTVTEGDTAHIQCCWNLNMTKGIVNWLKDSTQIVEDSNYNDITVNNSLCLIGKSKQTAACNCSNKIISNITRNDSGTYICKVTIEIPQFLQSIGNGTHLTVTSKNATNNDAKVSVSELPLPLSIIVPLLTLLFLVALICLYRVWKRHQERSVRVIHEAPHHEDEELKMEELGEAADQSSTSSKGSTQWCQVQVYESLDYLAMPIQGNG
ncbi:hypothetical protein J4Q44_G00379970 [Coregonus suidteri]|uniref:Ig-like domain-containing protein n=1 Tax=Coregonus suidteri TaxID=861788 RepID=A0AAN8KIU9_9TELE